MSGGLAFWSIKCIVITKFIEVNRFSFLDQDELIFEFLKLNQSKVQLWRTQIQTQSPEFFHIDERKILV